MEPNDAIIPVRPAGAAWSNVRDMVAYVKMELADGLLPDGQRYVSKESLSRAARAQVPFGKNATYRMDGGRHDLWQPVVHHGGATFGYLSDMMWLPDHGVGAVILTNSDAGWFYPGRSSASCSRYCSKVGQKPIPSRRPTARRISSSAPPTASC